MFKHRSFFLEEEDKVAKKLHVKHIVPGFLYLRKDTKEQVIVTRICGQNGLSGDERRVEIYNLATEKYGFAVRRAIVEAIRNGKLESLNGEEYR